MQLSFWVFLNWTLYPSQRNWKGSKMLSGTVNRRKWFLKLMGLRNQKRLVFTHLEQPLKVWHVFGLVLLPAAQIALEIPIITSYDSKQTVKMNTSTNFLFSHGNGARHLNLLSFLMTWVSVWVLDMLQIFACKAAYIYLSKILACISWILRTFLPFIISTLIYLWEWDKVMERQGFRQFADKVIFSHLTSPQPLIIVFPLKF